MSEAREPLVQQIKDLQREVELAREEAASAEGRAERAEQRKDSAEQISALKQMNTLNKKINTLDEKIANLRVALVEETAAKDRERADLAEERADLAEETAAKDRARAVVAELEIRINIFKSSYPTIKPLLNLLTEFTFLKGNFKDEATVRLQGVSPDSKQRSVENSSTNGYQLSRFHIDRCPGTASSFVVKKWSMTDATMERYIQRKLCRGDVSTRKHLVNECTSAVIKLREMFEWLRSMEVGIDEEDDFQPVFISLLEYIIYELLRTSPTGQNLQVHAVNWFDLQGTVQRMPRGVDQCENRSLTGRTDIAVMDGEDVEAIKSWLFHVEVKVPFSGTPLHRARNQLFGQLEAIAQMRNDHKPVLGCLTNLERITISLRLPGSSMELNDRVFFKTTGVTDPRQYTIQLLFLFCGLNDEELAALTKESTDADEETEEADSESAPSIDENGKPANNGGKQVESFGEEDDSESAPSIDENGKPAHNEGKQVKSSKKTGFQRGRRSNSSKTKKCNIISLNDDSDEEERQRKRWITTLDAWRLGDSYLCKESLNAAQRKHSKDTAGRSEKRPRPFALRQWLSAHLQLH